MPFFFSELTFFFVALLFPSHSAVSCDCKSRDVWVLVLGRQSYMCRARVASARSCNVLTAS